MKLLLTSITETQELLKTSTSLEKIFFLEKIKDTESTWSYYEERKNKEWRI